MSVPVWLTKHSAVLQSCDVVQWTDIPFTISNETLKMVELFVKQGVLSWSTEFWRVSAYLLLEGLEDALDRHLRKTGSKAHAEVVMRSSIGKEKTWYDHYFKVYNEDDCGRIGMFHQRPSQPCRFWVKHGRVDCLQWAHNSGISLTSNCYPMSVRSLECMKYLHEHNVNWHEQTSDFAAGAGTVACLTYARQNGAPWTSHVTLCAAWFGNLPCLKYAHEVGTEWAFDALRYAAAHGHLDCVKYMLEHGCPLDEVSAEYAAGQGKLECLRYLCENGCPYSKRTLQSFAAKHARCAEFIDTL